MKNTLIAFYSWGGYTRRIAHEIARRCDADLEDIQLAQDRAGWPGYVKSAYEALSRSLPSLGPLEHDPRGYRVVVLGTPIWAWHISSPIRAYVERHREAFQHVAFFCTMGGVGVAGVCRELEALCRQVPIAKLGLTDGEIDAGTFNARLAPFVEHLRIAANRTTEQSVLTSKAVPSHRA
jgi:flavodoxin